MSHETVREESVLIMAIVIALIVFDQLVKVFVSSTMVLGHSIPVLPGIFHITYIQNPGAAFGILANQRWVFIAAGVAILLLSVWFYPRVRNENRWIRYGGAMLLGGAVGNLIDRIRLGQVIDFLDFRVWPVFNIADIGIVVGVGCIMYELLFRKDAKET